MKIIYTAVAMSVVLLGAGCARESHHARYENYMPETTAQSDSTALPGADAKGGRSDSALATEVREALQRNAEIAPIASGIQITANNGTVILVGLVQSDQQAQQIESIVQNTRGVVTVNNQLRVDPGSVSKTSADQLPGGEADGPLAPTSSGNSLPRIYHDGANSLDDSNTNAVNSNSTGSMP